MTALDDATAAPLHWEWNGARYLASPLTDADFGYFLRWVKSERIALAKESVRDLPESQQTEILKDAIGQAAALSITSPETMQQMASLEGGIRLAWLSLRRQQPAVTLEQVWQMLQDPAALASIMEVVGQLNGSAANEGKKKAKKTILRAPRRKRG